MTDKEKSKVNSIFGMNVVESINPKYCVENLRCKVRVFYVFGRPKVVFMSEDGKVHTRFCKLDRLHKMAFFRFRNIERCREYYA